MKRKRVDYENKILHKIKILFQLFLIKILKKQ